MAIYHRDEYTSDADWALDVICENQSRGVQMDLVDEFLSKQFHGEDNPVLNLLCFLDLPNAKEKFEQFLIKEAEYHE